VADTSPPKLSLKKGKYFLWVGFDGTFTSSVIYWTYCNCIGTPYLNDNQEGLIGVSPYNYASQVAYANGVVYSTVANQLFVLSNPDANSLAYSADLPRDTISLDAGRGCIPSSYFGAAASASG
jgi:hypothetical protein